MYIKDKFKAWSTQNLPKNQIKQQAAKTSPVSQGSAKSLNASKSLKEILNDLEQPMLFDNGDEYCLVSNYDQDGVVYNACYSEFLLEDTRSVS